MMPSDFLWGAATAAYEIEGAPREGRRGESIWDHFVLRPGRIVDESGADPAADHYHRIDDDVALMREIGLAAYSFSIAWPRIQPDGHGRGNEVGLAFYERLIERLLESGIRPFVTLYHWDLPRALQERGGWANRDIVGRFADFADLLAYRFGDRVHDWVTLHAPHSVAWNGYVDGTHAPGLRHPHLYTTVVHNLLLAHGTVVPVLRMHARGGVAQVGITLALSPIVPASDREEDERAALRHDGETQRWYLDPLFKGSYPRDITADRAVEIDTGEPEIIAAPLDFLGVAVLPRTVVAMDSRDRPQIVSATLDHRPAGLAALLQRLQRDYTPSALYVLHDGVAEGAVPGVGSKVQDDERIMYLERQIDEVEQAVADGVPLRGYFAHSLLDGWEWTDGYTQRRGLIYVDRVTQKRTLKESAHTYTRVIAREGRRQ